MDEKQILRPLNYLFIALFAVIPWSLALMQIFLGLICVYLLIAAAVNRKNYFRYHRFYLLPLVFLIMQFVAALLSENIPISINNFIHTFWVILTIPFAASLPLRPLTRQNAINALIISASLLGLYAVIQFFTGINLTGPAELSMLGNYYRAVGTYTHFLTLSGNQLMIFAFAFIFAMQEENVSKKGLYFAGATLIALSIIATQGRGSWLGVVTILTLATVLFYRKYLYKILVIVGTLFITTMIILPDIRERFLNIFMIFSKYNLGRISLWQSALLMIGDHPWFGIGPGLFEQMLDRYRVEGFYNATGHAHNDYLHVAVQSGLPSMLVWISIWILFFVYGSKYLRTTPTDRTDRMIVISAVLAIAGILTASLTQCYFFDMENNILWWVIVATTLQVIIQSDKNTNQ